MVSGPSPRGNSPDRPGFLMPIRPRAGCCRGLRPSSAQTSSRASLTGEIRNAPASSRSCSTLSADIVFCCRAAGSGGNHLSGLHGRRVRQRGAALRLYGSRSMPGHGVRHRGILHAEPLLLSRTAGSWSHQAPPLERFRAKWVPVRVKKTRQNKNLELRF